MPAKIFRRLAKKRDESALDLALAVKQNRTKSKEITLYKQTLKLTGRINTWPVSEKTLKKLRGEFP